MNWHPVIGSVLQERVIGPSPNPQPGGPGAAIRLAFRLEPAQQGWTYQGLQSQLIIASTVTKARKPPHHDKVQHLGRTELLTLPKDLIPL